MIDSASLFGFAGAVVVLMLIPGPNVALIVANSVAYETRYGLLRVAGTSSAMLVQLGLTALGMVTLLGQLGAVFAWVRWLGAGYLLYLGIAQWRAPAVDLGAVPSEPKSSGIYLRTALVSLTNPKTLLFYGAFLPQFVDMRKPPGGQIAVLAAIFLVLAASIDSGWAMLAGRARGLLASRGRMRNRLSGGVLIGAGAALVATRSK